MHIRLLLLAPALLFSMAGQIGAQTSEPAEGQSQQQAPEQPGPSSPGTPPPDLTPAGQETPEATERPERLLPGADGGTVITHGDGLLASSDIIGLEVWSAGNRNVGNVSDILLDGEGRLFGILVDIGGFLGIGSRQIALPFEELTIVPDGDGSLATGNWPEWWLGQGVAHLRSEMTEEQLEAAPEFRGIEDSQ